MQVLFIPQTVCINVASSHGIGKRHDALTAPGYESYSKVGMTTCAILSIGRVLILM